MPFHDFTVEEAFEKLDMTTVPDTTRHLYGSLIFSIGFRIKLFNDPLM